MNRKEKSEKCLMWFKTLKIGNTVHDVKHKRQNKITNITSSSLELYQTKVTNKGINCKQWHGIESLVELTNDYL